MYKVRWLFVLGFSGAILALWLIGSKAHAGSLQLNVDASEPKWDSGALLSTNLLPDLYVRLYGAVKGQPKALLGTMPWAPLAKFRRPDTVSTSVHCYEATLALDTTGDKVPDLESPHTVEWCGTFADPPPVLQLAAPKGITGQAPAP